MSKSNSTRFRARAFVSFGTLFSFLITAVAGIILYLRPEGSLASWARWNILGIDKKGWEGIHNLFVILFLLFVVWHIYLNWKPLLNYIKKKSSENWHSKVESVAALGLIVLLLVAVINRWQPFWKVIDLRSIIKEGRYSVQVAPPAPNAEEMSLADLCRLIGVSADETLSWLNATGFMAENNKTTLAELADKYNTSPEKLYRIISSRAKEGADNQNRRRDRAFATVVGSWTSADDGSWIADATKWDGQMSPEYLKEIKASLWAPGEDTFITNGTAKGAFPLSVSQDVTTFSEGTLRVQFKLMGGPSDQTAGLVFNLRPAGEYLYVRYNTKEGNVALWGFVKGDRHLVARGSSKVQYPLNTWNDLTVTIIGKKVIGRVNDTLVVEHELDVPVEGRVGLWTKRDSLTAFREFRVESIK